jgi:hypothetical protein
MKLISSRLIASIAIVLASASIAAATDMAFVQIDRSNDVDRNRLIQAGVPLVAELSDILLAFGEPAAIERSAVALGLSTAMLDASPDGYRHGLAGLFPGSSLSDLEACGEVVGTGDGWVLVRAVHFDESACAGSTRWFFRELDLEPLGLSQPPPDAFSSFADGTPELLDPDPLVVDMVNQVDEPFAMWHWEGVVNSATTRHSESVGCQDAADRIYGLFDGWGLDPIYREHQPDHAQSVIGIIPGRITPDEVYIVIGHLDDMPSSGPAPGADDNASGSAMVTALAELMSRYDYASTIKFIAVTGEEQGLNGSESYAAAAAAAGENIQAVLNGDMIGWEGDGIPAAEDIDINLNSSSTWLGNLMVSASTDYPTGAAVNAFQCSSMVYSDHAPFWDEGWSAVCGITDNQGFCGEGGSYPYYHTSADTIANCGSGAAAFMASTIRLYLATAGHLADPLCERSDPPTGLAASPAGDNAIDLTWNSAGSGLSYEVHRAPGGCGDPGPFSFVGETQNLQLTDSTASGGVLYAYTVRSKDASGYCLSQASTCSEAQTTGDCTEPPRFDGATGVIDAETQDCLLTVTWAEPHTVYCGSDAAFNVYRSAQQGFVPEPSNRIATLVSGTSYDDMDVAFDEHYYYVVRAVDLANGAEDSNVVEVSETPTGPPVLGTWEDDSGDATDAVLALDIPWHTAASGGNSGPKVYLTGPYSNSMCTAATTPILELGPTPQLEFWSKYSIETGWDKGEVQISTDGFASHTRLEVGYPAYASHTGDACGFPTGDYFTGSDSSYDQYTASLAPWSGEEVQIRWILSTDSWVIDDGWWIDDIAVSDTLIPGMCDTAPIPLIFSDGFESGDTSAWSTTVP